MAGLASTALQEMESVLREFLTAQKGSEARFSNSRLIRFLQRHDGYPTLKKLLEEYRAGNTHSILLLDSLKRIIVEKYDGNVIIDYNGRPWILHPKYKIVKLRSQKALFFVRLNGKE